jgi:hypothetical protein
MKRIIFVGYLLVLFFTIFFLFGCATIQTQPAKIAPKSSFKFLPRVIVIAPITLEKDLGEDWEKFYLRMVGEEGFEKGREILYQTFQEELGPEFQVLKDLPAEQEEHLLVKMEIGEFGLNILMMVGTFGQYSKTMLTRLTVSKIPENKELISHEAQTVEHWTFWSRTLFYDSIRASGERVAKLLRAKIEKGE